MSIEIHEKIAEDLEKQAESTKLKEDSARRDAEIYNTQILEALNSSTEEVKSAIEMVRQEAQAAVEYFVEENVNKNAKNINEKAKETNKEVENDIESDGETKNALEGIHTESINIGDTISESVREIETMQALRENNSIALEDLISEAEEMLKRAEGIGVK